MTLNLCCLKLLNRICLSEIKCPWQYIIATNLPAVSKIDQSMKFCCHAIKTSCVCLKLAHPKFQRTIIMFTYVHHCLPKNWSYWLQRFWIYFCPRSGPTDTLKVRINMRKQRTKTPKVYEKLVSNTLTLVGGHILLTYINTWS